MAKGGTFKAAYTTTPVAALALTSGILYGYNLGVIAGAILLVEDHFALSPTLKEAAISAALFGAMLGAIAGGKAADWLGRRQAIVWATVLGGVAAVLGAIAPNALTVILYRLASGFSFGMLACVTPLYVAEISPSERRGRHVGLFSVALMCGLLCAYLADLIFNDVTNGWRYMFLAGILPALPLIVLALRMPESPRWLLQHGDRAGALESVEVLGEMRVGVHEVERVAVAKSASLSTLMKPAFRLAIFVALGLAFVRQGTGVAISTFYAPELLQQTGFSSVTVDLLGTVGVGVIYVIMTVVALRLVDHHGRRPLMLGGLIGMAIGLSVLVIVLRAEPVTNLGATIGSLGLFLFAAAFAIGPGAVVFVLMSEVLPQHVRAMGMGVASLVLWLTYFISAYTFPVLNSLIGSANVFLLYTIICIASLLFVYFCVQETKGQQLEDVGNR